MADILALSLLDSELGSIRALFDGSIQSREVEVDQLSTSPEGDFISVVDKALRNRETDECEARLIVSNVRKLLGHNYLQAKASWIASSFKGQVLLPSLYGSLHLRHSPSLQFYCMPGILSYQDGPKGLNLRRVECERAFIHRNAGHRQEALMTVPTSNVDALSRFSSTELVWKTRMDGERLLVHLSPGEDAAKLCRVDPAESLK